MHNNRIIGLALAMTLVASACFGGSGDSITDPATSPSTTQSAAGSGNSTGDSLELPCDGGAFPNDPDFRQLLCDAQNAELGVMNSGAAFDPTWGPRLSQAILKQASDREAAVAEIEAVIGEMTTAG